MRERRAAVRLAVLGLLTLLGLVALLWAARATTDGDDPAPPTTAPPADAMRGATLFRDHGCATCHRPTGTPSALGPGLVGLPRSAAQRVRDPDYRGGATTAEGYVREAIVDHCVDLVPGYGCPEVSGLGIRLTAADAADLTAFLLQSGSER
jgi:mono/diheme cytochrome c family protein